MSLLELTGVSVEPVTWWRIIDMTKDVRFGPNLPLLIRGGFKFSQILFFRFRGGTQLFSFSDGDWKMTDELQGW